MIISIFTYIHFLFYNILLLINWNLVEKVELLNHCAEKNMALVKFASLDFKDPRKFILFIRLFYLNCLNSIFELKSMGLGLGLGLGLGVG
jgi:hypothetical protein